MDEKQQLAQLRRGSEKALEWLIRRYTAYVSAVISNQLRGFGSRETAEELTADVFYTMWQNRLALSSECAKGCYQCWARSDETAGTRNSGEVFFLQSVCKTDFRGNKRKYRNAQKQTGAKQEKTQSDI